MTPTPSPMWATAAALDVVPVPANPTLAAMFHQWWQMPRTMGCSTAKHSPTWFVVLPDPRVLCPSCGLNEWEAERRCAYCWNPIRRVSRSDALIYEMGHVRLLGRAHHHCTEKAERRDDE